MTGVRSGAAYHPAMMRRLASCTAALALLVAVTGCSDDDATPDDGPEATDGDETSDASDPGGDGSDSDDGDPDGDAGQADDEDYVDAYVALIVGASDMSDDEAHCIATAVVDAAGGADSLAAAGLGPEDWTQASGSFADIGLPSDDATVEGFAEDLGGCADGHDLLLLSVAPDVSEEVRSCVAGTVDEAEVRYQIALSSIRGSDALDERDVDVFDLLRSCEDGAVAG